MLRYVGERAVIWVSSPWSANFTTTAGLYDSTNGGMIAIGGYSTRKDHARPV